MTTQGNNKEEIQDLENRLKNLKREARGSGNGISYMIPVSIIIAGILVAGAVYFNNSRSSGPSPTTADTATQPALPPVGSTEDIRPITSADHIRGNPDAPVKIVEYSDFECPFCKGFHDTMNQVLSEYGKDGQVAWVYRHFPLDQLHPVKARREAITSECIAEIAGNDAFWQFADKFFAVTPSNNQTDVDTVIPQIIGELGLSQSAIDECVASGRYDDHIQEDIDNAVATGGRGTPWSVVVAEGGKTFSLSGAQPYNAVKQLIDLALGS